MICVIFLFEHPLKSNLEISGCFFNFAGKENYLMKIQEKPHRPYSRNHLLRYRAVMQEFNQHDCRYTPISVIWREFIYPKFFISRKTLYKILSTDVEGELAMLAD